MMRLVFALALCLCASSAQAQFSAGLHGGYGAGFGQDTPFGWFLGLRAGYLRKDALYIGFAQETTFFRRIGPYYESDPKTIVFLAELGKEWLVRNRSGRRRGEAATFGDISVRPYLQLGPAVQTGMICFELDSAGGDPCPYVPPDVGAMLNPGAVVTFHTGPHFAWVFDLRLSTLWFLEPNNWYFDSTDGVALSFGFRITPFPHTVEDSSRR